MPIEIVMDACMRRWTTRDDGVDATHRAFALSACLSVSLSVCLSHSWSSFVLAGDRRSSQILTLGGDTEDVILRQFFGEIVATKADDFPRNYVFFVTGTGHKYECKRLQYVRKAMNRRQTLCTEKGTAC